MNNLYFLREGLFDYQCYLWRRWKRKKWLSCYSLICKLIFRLFRQRRYTIRTLFWEEMQSFIRLSSKSVEIEKFHDEDINVEKKCWENLWKIWLTDEMIDLHLFQRDSNEFVQICKKFVQCGWKWSVSWKCFNSWSIFATPLREFL